ncbi:MAG: response regulator [Nitrospirota bacterium]
MVEQTPQPLLPVLIVDDEPNILSALKRLLADEAYEIFTAMSGKEGLKIISENKAIGVIISDQRMPEMNGAEFLEKAKTLVPDAARIVLTGYADIQATVDAINKGGALRYIAKPWNDQELITIVREAACRYELLQENKRLTEIVQRQNAELKKWSSQLEYDVQCQSIELQKKDSKLKEIGAEWQQLLNRFRESRQG